jgi:hypothetical protein
MSPKPHKTSLEILKHLQAGHPELQDKDRQEALMILLDDLLKKAEEGHLIPVAFMKKWNAACKDGNDEIRKIKLATEYLHELFFPPPSLI